MNGEGVDAIGEALVDLAVAIVVVSVADLGGGVFAVLCEVVGVLASDPYAVFAGLYAVLASAVLFCARRCGGDLFVDFAVAVIV